LATISFRRGENGYTGTVDTFVGRSNPNTSYAATTTLEIDTGTLSEEQALLRFDNLFGDGSGQVPPDAAITSATLTLHTSNGSGQGGTLHRMLSNWTPGATWNSLANGIQLGGTEAVAAADVTTGSTATGTRAFDVTASLNAWTNGADNAAQANDANNGWVFKAGGTDGWDFSSSEAAAANRPLLTVTYATGSTPPPSSWQPFDVTLAPTDRTAAVAGTGDRADDLAFLLHPDDLSQSVILGTNKSSTSGGGGGLYVFGLDGEVIDIASTGQGINNVDVRYQFNLGGTPVELIGATDRANTNIVFYDYDFAKRDLTPIGTIESGQSYGFALGYVDGTYYAYGTTDGGGTVNQYALDGSSGTIKGTLVRTISVGSRVEGVAVDDETGQLYVSEEDVGIWRYDASANGGTGRVLVDKVGTGGHLTADVEGLAIYRHDDGTGLLMASSQGEDAFEVYETATNAWRGTLSVDGVTHTDGIDVTNVNLGGAYTEGMFAAQVDVVNNFAMVSWNGISDATGLPSGSDYDPRYDPYII
jgi:3-phytase